MNTETGKYIMIAGVLILIAGLIIYLFNDKLRWIGHLPGDIRIVKENFRFYFPITTLIIFSIIISGILMLARKILS
jgi:uncharacterized protein HemY